MAHAWRKSDIADLRLCLASKSSGLGGLRARAVAFAAAHEGFEFLAVAGAAQLLDMPSSRRFRASAPRAFALLAIDPAPAANAGGR